MEELRSGHSTSLLKPEGKRHKHRQEYNIKMDMTSRE
jgi:hypothetical protein